MVVVHHGIWEIPYTYSEVGGIQHNRVVTSPRIFVRNMLTPKGLLQRPLSVASYTLDYALWGDRPAGFHLTNLVIHAVNTSLVFLLARDFFVAPAVASLVFALHPLATACVSQIFGRNYSLATLFVLLAFYLYLRWRAPRVDADDASHRALEGRHIAVVLALYVLAVLSKQNLVIAPVLLAWWEIGARNTTLHEIDALLFGTARRYAAAVVLVVVGVGVVVFYAIPLSKTAAMSPTTYLLSQIANVPVVLRLYLLPYQTALIHDLYLYDDLLHVEIWLGLAAIAAIAYVAWRWRAHPAGWLLGAIVICLVPSNSVLPKNDLVREWRLYPSLAFYALLVAHAVAALARRARDARAWIVRYAPYGALAGYLATFAHADVVQNTVYRSAVTTWQQVLARYPYSADAMNNIGIAEYKAGRLDEARRYFAMAADAAPDVSLYRHNLAQAYAALGERELAAQQFDEARRVRAAFGRRMMALHYR
jgi:protein O-mannosyl-transferase